MSVSLITKARQRAIGFLRRRRVSMLVPPSLSWRLALPDEVSFWDEWLSTKGREWPEGYACRLDPGFPLQDFIARHLDTPNGGSARILDVASGPMTWIGKRWGERKIEIDPVDILAQFYEGLLCKHGITPLIRTRYASIEGLCRSVGEAAYDLVFCKNALDHCRNPMRGIREMVLAAKPGRTVLLHHHRNEAISLGYAQLHQWNFDVDPGGDGFLISARSGLRWDVRAELAGIAEVSSECIGGNRESGDIITAIRKIP